MAHRIEVALKKGFRDARGEGVAAAARMALGVHTGPIESRKVYAIDAPLSREEIERVRAEFTDPVIEESTVGVHPAEPFSWMLLVGFRPGVTDNVGRSAKTAIGDIIGRSLTSEDGVYASGAYLFRSEEITRSEVERIAWGILANSLIETVEILSYDDWRANPPSARVARILDSTPVEAKEIDLEVSKKDLMRISDEGILSLSLDEMIAIRDHFRNAGKEESRRALGLGQNPTDVELEMIAQTWSEHCKHKIFNGIIRYRDENGKTEEIRSLFKTYIQGATVEIASRVDWLVSVFKDNAGVIAFNDRMNLAYKVETHNSPSALDPYGGAMTGIVGVNRDPFGTGMGADLLINVWGYCFASPFYSGEIPSGLLHPWRIRDGVHKGVIDGGNQSGIPYGLGWEFYDDRYLGKPLVYCGTVGFMPKEVAGRPSHEKSASPGDRIVMTGGRIGKDGIHGATFSSVELRAESPSQAVQIGDPITQKKMTDFLLEARDLGLYAAITDNGAGGLSSSVGEMATSCGGAELDLKCAPLKYQGLQPWEILLSEAQERMTLAVPPGSVDAFLELARRREVEATVLGVFTDSGHFHVRYGERTVAYVALGFLHDGFPPLRMEAVWTPPGHETPRVEENADCTADLVEMAGRLNLCSKEFRSRQYDHEVKARTVVKPFVGRRSDVPSDATVFLAEHGGREGIVLSMGFNSHYSDIDPYWMMASVIDEAVRKIVAVGGRPDRIAGLDNFCWPDPVQSDRTPDGRYKLAQLVRANRALYDFTTAFDVPCISGKDSMKNDSIRGGVKISIPPSVLFSAIGKIDDIGKAVTLDLKRPGDRVYVLGITRPEMGASEYLHMLNDRSACGIGGDVPIVEVDAARNLYGHIHEAVNRELVTALHPPGLGGLGMALATMAMGGELGIDADLSLVVAMGLMNNTEVLFSESNSRFVATVPSAKAGEFERCVAGTPFAHIGEVTEEPILLLRGVEGGEAVRVNVLELKARWKEPLEGV